MKFSVIFWLGSDFCGFTGHLGYENSWCSYGVNRLQSMMFLYWWSKIISLTVHLYQQQINTSCTHTPHEQRYTLGDNNHLPTRRKRNNCDLLVSIRASILSSGSLPGVHPLHAAGPSTTKRRLEREIDVLLRVETDDERENGHDLTTDTERTVITIKLILYKKW